MSDNDIVRRKVERTSKCRGCDKTMRKGEDVIYTYSHRNRGQHIYFCMDCVTTIGSLAISRGEDYV